MFELTSRWVLGVALVASITTASAGTITVTSTGSASAGTCTLGQAIYAANRANNPGNTTPAGATTISPLSNSTASTVGIGTCTGASVGLNVIKLPNAAAINFGSDSPDNFWYGPNALPPIASPIFIQGNGATLSITLGTSPRLRFFFVGADPQSTATPGYNTPGPGQLTLSNLTLTGGRQLGGSSFRGGGGAGMGGAIYNQGTTTLSAVTLNGNQVMGGNGLNSNPSNGGGGMGAEPADLVGGGMGGAVPLGTSEAGHDANPVYGFGADGGGTPNGMGGHDANASGDAGDGSGAGAYGYNNGGLGGGGGGGGGFGGGPGGLGTGAFGGGTSGGNGGAFGAGGTPGNLFAQGGGGGGGVGGGGGSCNSSYCGSGGFGGGGAYASGVTYSGAGGGFGGGGANLGGVGGFGGGGSNAPAGSDGGSGAGFGGAIFNHAGTLYLLNSTLTGNTAIGAGSVDVGNGGSGGSGLGGAVFNLNGSVTVSFSTLAANTVTAAAADRGAGSASGGAIYSLAYNGATSVGSTSAALTLENTILSNSAGGNDLTVDQPGSVSGGLTNQATASTTTLGANLVMSSQSLNNAAALPSFDSAADPLLGALGNNGGGTKTMALGGGSPAIDAAAFATSQPYNDQRGYLRSAGSGPDLGAFESGSSAVVKASPALSIDSSDPNPSEVGQSYTVIVSFTGGNSPTGVIGVSDTKDACTILLPANSCQMASHISGAPKTLTASYSGDLSNNAASDTASHTVVKASPSVAIVGNTPNPSVVGQSYMVSASVTGGYFPTGTIGVSDGTNNCLITLPSPSCNLASMSAGGKSLSATYNGDTNNNPASDNTGSQTVNQATTTTTLLGVPSSANIGVAFTVTPSISVNAPGAGAPTGNVRVRLDGSTVCTKALPASVACDVTLATTGSHDIDAVYEGDADFSGSTSAVSNVTGTAHCSPSDITLTTQAQVNALGVGSPPCSDVVGVLTISGADISDLTPLTALTSVGNDIIIDSNSILTSLAGLNHIVSTGNKVEITNNPALASIGLTALTQVGTDLTIDGNAVLTSLAGVSHVTSTGNQVRIQNNPLLTNVGMTALTQVGTDLTIDNNAALKSLAGFNNIVSTGNQLRITNNTKLASLSGLGGFCAVGTDLTVSGNPALAACWGIVRLVDGTDDCQAGPGPGSGGIPDIGGSVSISGNLAGCNSATEIVNSNEVFANGFEP